MPTMSQVITPPGREWTLGGMTFEQRELSLMGEIGLLNLVADALPRLEDGGVTLDDLLNLIPPPGEEFSGVAIAAVAIKALRVLPEIIVDAACLILRAEAVDSEGHARATYPDERKAITDGLNTAKFVSMLQTLAEQNEVASLIAPFEKAGTWITGRVQAAAARSDQPLSPNVPSQPASTD